MDSETLVDSVVHLVGIIVSIVCLIALWTTWWMLPRWRTLHNYVSVQHITLGTLHMIGAALIAYNDDAGVLVALTSGIVFFATMSWSLASSLVAYFKLVLLHNRKLSNEKLIITLFVYGLTLIVFFIKLVAVENVYDLEQLEVDCLGLYLLYLILILKIALFISVITSVMSCCKKSMSQRKFGHVVALVGAALICDAGTMLWLFLILFLHDDVMDAWFYNRMIPQAAFVLFNPSSRAHWRWYFNRRRRMNVAV